MESIMDKTIIPPTEIRSTIAKTAWFIFNKGIAYEGKLRENERNNPKFCFLNPNDPYHAYYVQTKKNMFEGREYTSDDLHDEEPDIVLPFSFSLSGCIDMKSLCDHEEESLSAMYNAMIGYEDSGASNFLEKLYRSYRAIVDRSVSTSHSRETLLKHLSTLCEHIHKSTLYSSKDSSVTYNWDDFVAVEHIDLLPDKADRPALEPLELCAMSREERLLLLNVNKKIY
jgi:hypothetical protein